MLWDNDITADPVFPEGVFGKRHWGRTDGYYSGALMGNGLLGTNLYKLTDGVYRLNVGRSDVTEAREPFNVYNSGRLPIGYFTFSTVGQVQDEKMRLSIYDAVTSGALKTNAGRLDFRTYVHSERECIIFDTHAEGGETGWKLDFVPQKAISPRYVFNSANAPKGYVNAEGNSILIHISTKTAISASAFRHWLRILRLPTLQDGMSWLGRPSETARTAGRLRP